MSGPRLAYSVLCSLFALHVVEAIELPMGRHLERYVLPLADTLEISEEGIDSLPAGGGATFTRAVSDWQNDGRYRSLVIDTQNLAVRYAYSSVAVFERAGGLPVEAIERFDATPGLLNFRRFTTDASGRISGIVFGSRRSEEEELTDSVNYSWSHEGCADEIWSDYKVTWEVDAQGRCSHGTGYGLENGAWKADGREYSIVWDGERVASVVQFAVNGSARDTLLVDVYSYDAVGNWAGFEERQYLSGGRKVVVVKATYSWNGSRLISGQELDYDEQGRLLVTTLAKSPSPTSRIVRGSPEAVGLSVSGGREALALSNFSTNGMTIKFLGTDGRELESVGLDAGATRIVRIPGQGTVLVLARRAAEVVGFKLTLL